MKLRGVSRGGGGVNIQVSMTTGEVAKILTVLKCFLDQVTHGFEKDRRVLSDLDRIYVEASAIAAKYVNRNKFYEEVSAKQICEKILT